MAGSCCGSSKVTVRKQQKASACCAGGTVSRERASCSCNAADFAEEALCGRPEIKADWVTGYVKTEVGDIPQVATKLKFKDTLGSWKCRWSIGRMDYAIEPGLYCVGTPDSAAPVLVTANYKMTFDRLREQLAGLDLWLMVLDTDAVNVWCAAGKGTFGTEELIRRISAVRLDRIVSHRTLVLPQLGAVGVAAYEVAKQTGFKVVYGTIRARDLKAFLAGGMKATEEMRTVKFTFADRIVLTPVELVGAMKPVFIVFGLLFILNAVGFSHYGLTDLYGLLASVLIGCVITPALLPWVPGRAFSFKGGLMGLIWAVLFLFANGFPYTAADEWLKAAGYFLLLPTISAFCTMNFTGSSTYTSLSGVDREMKIAVPTMLFTAAGGVLALLASDFVRLLG